MAPETKSDLVIVYLSISLLVVQFFWMKAEKRAAYLQGQADVYAELARMSPEAEPYIDRPIDKHPNVPKLKP